MTSETVSNMLRRTTVGDVIRRHALNHPNKPALLVESMDGTSAEYSWREFNTLINRTAHALTSLGVTKGDKVGVFALNGPQFAALLYAAAKIGAIVAPAGAGLRGADLTYVVKHCDAQVVFVDEFLLDAFTSILPDVDYLTMGFIRRTPGSEAPKGWVDLAQMVAEQNDAEPEVVLDGDDVATLTYTSGTEAAPKGVLMTHTNLINMITSGHAWDLRPEDVALHVLPLFYTGGVGVFMMCHLLGQTVVLPELPEPVKMAAAMAKHQVSFIVLPPTLWIRLLQVPGIEESARSMRIATTFGATISKSMITGWSAVCPSMRWNSYYGQSETSCSGTIGQFKNLEEICEGDLGWVGRPCQNLEVRVVDPHDDDVPRGEVGQILFRGPSVFKGYYKDEERTAAAFAGGWLHSGDLGRLNADGELFFVDRVKDMVKSGGENISSASVEYAISGHPKVAEVAAFGVPHPDWMEALTVAVTVKPGESLTADEVVAYCKETLPRFKVPKKIVIVEDFPRGPSGKILKRELREQYKDVHS